MLNVREVFSRKLSFTIFSEKRCNLIIFISVFTKVSTLGRRRTWEAYLNAKSGKEIMYSTLWWSILKKDDFTFTCFSVCKIVEK